MRITQALAADAKSRAAEAQRYVCEDYNFRIRPSRHFLDTTIVRFDTQHEYRTLGFVAEPGHTYTARVEYADGSIHYWIVDRNRNAIVAEATDSGE